MPPDPLEGLCFALQSALHTLVYTNILWPCDFTYGRSNLVLIGHFVQAINYCYIVLCMLMVMQSYFWWILGLHLPSFERICGRDAKDQSSGLVSEKIRWYQGQFLQVFGFATVEISIHGEILQVAVVAIDPLTTEALGLVIMYC